MQIVYQRKLKHQTDKKVWYDTRVERVDAYHGQLVVELNGKELLREDTTLAFNAVFGPDVDDVHRWEKRCIKFVDEELR